MTNKQSFLKIASTSGTYSFRTQLKNLEEIRQSILLHIIESSSSSAIETYSAQLNYINYMMNLIERKCIVIDDTHGTIKQGLINLMQSKIISFPDSSKIWSNLLERLDSGNLIAFMFQVTTRINNLNTSRRSFINISLPISYEIAKELEALEAIEKEFRDLITLEGGN